MPVRGMQHRVYNGWLATADDDGEPVTWRPNADMKIPGRMIVPTLTRRSILLGAMAAPFSAHAQTWPSGSIKIVIPFPPGGSTDVMIRLVQNDLQQRLGATIII
jgi:hypothetical protein